MAQRNAEQRNALKSNINMQKTSTYMNKKNEAENLKYEKREATNML